MWLRLSIGVAVFAAVLVIGVSVWWSRSRSRKSSPQQSNRQIRFVSERVIRDAKLRHDDLPEVEIRVQELVEANANADPMTSAFKVSALLVFETSNGQLQMFCGVNAETPLQCGQCSICAEQSAFGQAVTAGVRKTSPRLAAVLVYVPIDSPAFPCGRCRGFIEGWGNDETLILPVYGQGESLTCHEKTIRWSDLRPRPPVDLTGEGCVGQLVEQLKLEDTSASGLDRQRVNAILSEGVRRFRSTTLGPDRPYITSGDVTALVYGGDPVLDVAWGSTAQSANWDSIPSTASAIQSRRLAGESPKGAVLVIVIQDAESMPVGRVWQGLTEIFDEKSEVPILLIDLKGETIVRARYGRLDDYLPFSFGRVTLGK